jgi:hypothetical protein
MLARDLNRVLPGQKLPGPDQKSSAAFNLGLEGAERIK